jgi:hypothetical protein
MGLRRVGKKRDGLFFFWVCGTGTKQGRYLLCISLGGGWRGADTWMRLALFAFLVDIVMGVLEDHILCFVLTPVALNLHGFTNLLM